MRQLTHYFSALVFLGACAVIYQNVVTPRIEPPTVASVTPQAGPQSGGENESLADLFPPGSWQLGPCKQLQSSAGMLLFSHWEQISNDQWKLWPVTVVVGRGLSGEAKQAPVILDAPEGAEIIFTESLDVMSGGAPPIRQGRMIGRVEIRRPGDDNGKEALHIQTANVGIDNRKVWTTESIEMKIGEASMVGRDLTIHFAGPSGSTDTEAVLDRMELIYLDELLMPLEDGGLMRKQLPDAKAQLSIECGGRLEYDFALDELSLRDSVSLIHQIRGLEPDFFRCETLRLKLLDPTDDKIRRDGPLDWLLRITATGSPAIARLPSFDTEMAAEVIDFDAIKGLIQANGETGVRVRRGGITATLAQLAYQFDPRRPDAVGAIDVRGAGIININDPEIPLLKAQWRTGFKLQPTAAATAEEFDADVELFLDGDIYAKLSDGGEFHAESVEGVLQPKTEIDPETGKRKMTLVPARFQANQGVRIDTSALAAETETLRLHFVDPDTAGIPQRNRPADAAKKPNALRQWVTQPGEANGTVDPVARPRPVIRGDSIRALLRLDTEGVTATDMSVEGAIHVTHVLKTGGQLLPAKLTGQRMTLTDGGGEDVLQLESGPEHPARFELGDGFFVGPMIQIRPSDNVIWINSAGEFRLPTAALPTRLGGEGKSQIRWVRPPHCRWHGEMVFDGRTAMLTEGIELQATLIDRGETWELAMRGDRLQVDMRNDVVVRDMQSVKNATIHRVSLTESAERPVLVQATRRAGDGVLEAKHLLHAKRLTLTPGEGLSLDSASLAGQLEGVGPGWYRGWSIPPKKSDKEKGLLPVASTNDGGTPKLTGIHLAFNDALKGDLAARQIEFDRGVRIGVRPVASWDESFDATTMDAISLGESTLDCDRLRFRIAPGYGGRLGSGPLPWEMEAVSGVVFRTRGDRGLLEGTASRAAYSSSKDLFTVDGAPNRAAIFRQTLPDGSKGPEGAVKTMTVRPDTMEIKNLQLERLNIATPKSLSGR